MKLRDKIISRLISEPIPNPRLLEVSLILNGFESDSSPKALPILMKPGTAANFLGWSPSKLRALAANGVVPFVNLPGADTRWYRKTDLEKMVDDLPDARTRVR